MMNWKFTDNSHKVAWRQLDSEIQESRLVSSLPPDTTIDSEDPPTPEQIAAEVETTRLAKDATTAKAHAKLHALSQMSPAQVQTWVAANVTNLAQAQDAIATLAIAVSVLIRRI